MGRFPRTLWAFLKGAEPADGEVRRGDVQGSAFMFGQQTFENVSKNMSLAIDDVRKLHTPACRAIPAPKTQKSLYNTLRLPSVSTNRFSPVRI